MLADGLNRGPFSPPEPPWHRRLNSLFAGILFIACTALIIEYGFYPSAFVLTTLHFIELTTTILVFLIKLGLLMTSARPRQYFASHWVDYALLFTLVAQIFVYLELRQTIEFKYLEARELHFSILTAYIVVVQLGLVGLLAIESPIFHRALVRLKLHPARSFLLSFAFIILGGTLLLCLPKSVPPGKTLSFIDALFTATSAVCVTGLAVVDTGTHFSLMGQCVIMVLIQVGGLGIFTFTAFLAVLLGRGLAHDEAKTVGGWLNVDVLALLTRTVRSILTATFLIEAAGALFLYIDWAEEIPNGFDRAFASVFHAVSAFCNAGFGLFPDNLTRFVAAPITNLSIMGLIVLGGLGFEVLTEVVQLATLRKRLADCSLHTMLVVPMTLVLIIGGALLMLLTEQSNTLHTAGTAERIWASLFQSVTLRTAGFNTVDITRLLPVTAVWMIVFMAIGGSPGSTAGGVKTTTVSILIAALKRRIMGGGSPMTIYRRKLTPGSVRRAFIVMSLFVATAILLTLGLTIIEPFPTLSLLFETVSALGTVGLSLGVTASLSALGKFILVIAMFIGRIGPLTIGIAVTGIDTPEAPAHEGERVLIG